MVRLTNEWVRVYDGKSLLLVCPYTYLRDLAWAKTPATWWYELV